MTLVIFSGATIQELSETFTVHAIAQPHCGTLERLECQTCMINHSQSSKRTVHPTKGTTYCMTNPRTQEKSAWHPFLFRSMMAQAWLNHIVYPPSPQPSWPQKGTTTARQHAEHGLKAKHSHQQSHKRGRKPSENSRLYLKATTGITHVHFLFLNQKRLKRVLHADIGLLNKNF